MVECACSQNVGRSMYAGKSSILTTCHAPLSKRLTHNSVPLDLQGLAAHLTRDQLFVAELVHRQRHTHKRLLTYTNCFIDHTAQPSLRGEVLGEVGPEGFEPPID
jgi:hypothetical protein